jgi:hypothetical protein
MPRMKEDSKTLAADLASRLDRLVAAARKEGREEALGQLRSLMAGGLAPRRGPGRPRKYPVADAAPRAKSRKKRKNPWASMTAEQKAERVRKMLAGRGLKPKGG